MTVFNSRTRGLAPMTMGNLSDENNNQHAIDDESVENEDGELYRLDIRNGKKVFTKFSSLSKQSNTKGGGKGKTDRECFRCEPDWSHQRRSPSQISHQWRDPENLRPKGKGVGGCEDEETEASQNVPLGTIDLGSFEAVSDHGDEVDVDESTYETTEMMPPLPPDSWFKKTETLCRKFRKPCSGDHRDEEYPFPDCWDWEARTASTFCNKWILGHEDGTEVCTRCERLPLSELSCLFCVSEAGGVPTSANSRRHSVTSPAKQKTDRATTSMMESGSLTRWT